ncbi:MAG: GNAT family N-acetyltransferase [Nocardioides sp.]
MPLDDTGTSAMPEGLQGKRLSLRLLGPADFNVIHALFSSSGHTIGDGPVSDAALTLAWLERRRRLHEEIGLAWYGLWVGGQKFAGTCGVFLGRCGEEPELGYEIAVSQRGHGFAAEAAELVTHACHAAGHARSWATIRPTNVASVRTALAAGYVFARSDPDAKGVLDYYLHVSGDGS